MGTRQRVDRRRFVQLSGSAAAVLLAGCAGADEPTDGAGNNTTDTTMATDTTDVTETTETTEQTTTAEASAYLRAAHMSPGAPAVDVYVDGQAAFQGVDFTTTTQYAALTPGEHDVRITAADDESTVVFEQSVQMSQGFQTAVAYGVLGAGGGTTTTTAGTQTTTGTTTETTTATTTSANQTTTTTTGGGMGSRAFSVGLLEDESESPSSGETLARLFHASPDAPTVEVFAAGSGDVIFDDVAFGEATDYQTLEAGTYTLGVRPAAPEGEGGEPVASIEVELDGGTAVTLFAAGYVQTSEQERALNIVSAVDGRTSEPDG